MTLTFSDLPGRRERHLQRRHANPLFADPPPLVTPVELEQARRADLEEAEGFREDFLALVQEAMDLKPNEQSEVILKLKARLDQAYEQASGLAGDQSAIKAAIPQLVAPIMAAVRQGAGNDAMALQELAHEDEARAMHYRLLEQPLVADLLAPDTPIPPGELLPTLLTAKNEALEAALQLFDPQQIGVLAEEGRELLARLEREGEPPSGARERLAAMEAGMDGKATTIDRSESACAPSTSGNR